MRKCSLHIKTGKKVKLQHEHWNLNFVIYGFKAEKKSPLCIHVYVYISPYHTCPAQTPKNIHSDYCWVV